MPKPSDFLTVRDVAEVLSLSTQRVYQLIAAGKIPVLRFGKWGKVFLIPVDAVRDYIAARVKP